MKAASASSTRTASLITVRPCLQCKRVSRSRMKLSAGSWRSLHFRGGMLQLKSKVLLACVLALIGASSLHAQVATASDSGVFSILSGGRKVGTEKFKIAASSSGVEASGELQIEAEAGGRVTENCTLKLDGTLRPVSYER